VTNSYNVNHRKFNLLILKEIMKLKILDLRKGEKKKRHSHRVNDVIDHTLWITEN